jgi:negative regulator of flagellin synthesis FlgM
MISKIKDTSAQALQQYQKSDPVKNDGEKSVGAGATTTTEKVDLSAKAKDILRIKQIMDQTPDVREAKVQELKRQIDSGTYTVDTDKVADKMVGEALIDIIA